MLGGDGGGWVVMVLLSFLSHRFMLLDMVAVVGVVMVLTMMVKEVVGHGG